MSLQNLIILSLLLLQSKIILNDSKHCALYQINDLLVGVHGRETYWIEWNIFSFLMESHYCIEGLYETLTIVIYGKNN